MTSSFAVSTRLLNLSDNIRVSHTRCLSAARSRSRPSFLVKSRTTQLVTGFRLRSSGKGNQRPHKVETERIITSGYIPPARDVIVHALLALHRSLERAQPNKMDGSALQELSSNYKTNSSAKCDVKKSTLNWERERELFDYPLQQFSVISPPFLVRYRRSLETTETIWGPSSLENLSASPRDTSVEGQEENTVQTLFHGLLRLELWIPMALGRPVLFEGCKVTTGTNTSFLQYTAIYSD